MRISLTPPPILLGTTASRPHNLRELLDDVGIEVKRVEDDAPRSQSNYWPTEATTVAMQVSLEKWWAAWEARATPPYAELTIGDSPIPLRLETDLCLLYTATAIDIADVEQSLPEEILHPLIEASLQPVNAAVDTTNLANLEFRATHPPL